MRFLHDGDEISITINFFILALIAQQRTPVIRRAHDDKHHTRHLHAYVISRRRRTVYNIKYDHI